MVRTSLITRPDEDYISTLLHFQPQIYSVEQFIILIPRFPLILRDFLGGGKVFVACGYAVDRRREGDVREAAQKSPA
jgi:hypothetical protein